MSSIIAHPIPSPLLSHVGFQFSVQHLHDIGADSGQEFPRVEGSAQGKVEITTMGVRRDDQTLVGCERIPGRF